MRLINSRTPARGKCYWGKIQSQYTVCKGLRWVSTPSHGGWMVSKGLAHKILRPIAIEHASTQGNYLYFEEDCQWAILESDLLLGSASRRELLREYYRWSNQIDITDPLVLSAKVRECVETVERYYPEYRVAITPGLSWALPDLAKADPEHIQIVVVGRPAD